MAEQTTPKLSGGKVRKAAPTPQGSRKKARKASVDDDVAEPGTPGALSADPPSSPAPAASPKPKAASPKPTAAASPARKPRGSLMGSLMSALPRPGGLLDAMRQRGTLPAKGISGLFAGMPPPPAASAASLRVIPRAQDPASPAPAPASKEPCSPLAPQASPQKQKPCIPATAMAMSPGPLKAEAAQSKRKGSGNVEAEAGEPKRKGSGNAEAAATAATAQKRKGSSNEPGRKASAEAAGRKASAEADGAKPKRKASAEAEAAPAGKPAGKKAAAMEMSPAKARTAMPLATTPSPEAPGKSRAKRPPVPSFAQPPQAIEPWLALRKIRLPPKKLEDNYEISDKGDDSDAEEPDRSHKKVPDWSGRYLELIEQQLNTDPDTIFGSRVPKCDLDLIFKDADYAKIRTERPRRRRGSSGEWHRDRLSRSEICRYKKKMGHAKRWIARKLSIAPPPPVVVLDGA